MVSDASVSSVRALLMALRRTAPGNGGIHQIGNAFAGQNHLTPTGALGIR